MSRLHYFSSGYHDGQGAWHYPSRYDEGGPPSTALPYGSQPHVPPSSGFPSQQVAYPRASTQDASYPHGVANFPSHGQIPSYAAYPQNVNQGGAIYAPPPSNGPLSGPNFISGNVQNKQGEPPSKRMRPNYIPPVVTKYEVPDHVKRRHMEQTSKRAEPSGPPSHVQGMPTWQYGQTPQPYAQAGYPHDLPTPSTAGSPVFRQANWTYEQHNQYGMQGYGPSANSPYTPLPSPYDTANRYLPPSHGAVPEPNQGYSAHPVAHYGAYEMTPAKSISPAMRSSLGVTQHPYEEKYPSRAAHGGSIVSERDIDSHDTAREPVRTVIVPSEVLPTKSPARPSNNDMRMRNSSGDASGEYDPMNPSAGLENENMRSFRQNHAKPSVPQRFSKPSHTRHDQQPARKDAFSNKSKKKHNQKGGQTQELSKPSQPGKVNKKRYRAMRNRGRKRKQADAAQQQAQ